MQSPTAKKQSISEPTPIEVAIAIAAPPAAFTFVECLYHALSMYWIASTPVGPRMLTYGPYMLLVPIGGWAFRIGCSRGRTGILASAVGFAICLFMVHFFRGSLAWPGVFDGFARSKFHLYGPVTLAFFVGLFSGVRRPQSEAVPCSSQVLTFVVAGLACLWTWFDAHHDIEFYSLYPYTRNLAMSIVLAALLVVAALNKWLWAE